MIGIVHGIRYNLVNYRVINNQTIGELNIFMGVTSFL